MVIKNILMLIISIALLIVFLFLWVYAYGYLYEKMLPVCLEEIAMENCMVNGLYYTSYYEFEDYYCAEYLNQAEGIKFKYTEAEKESCKK